VEEASLFPSFDRSEQEMSKAAEDLNVEDKFGMDGAFDINDNSPRASQEVKQADNTFSDSRGQLRSN